MRNTATEQHSDVSKEMNTHRNGATSLWAYTSIEQSIFIDMNEYGAMN